MNIIENKYMISNDEIGKGTFAKVYIAYNIENNVKLAVKKMDLNQENMKSHTVQDKIRHEINLSYKINHHNIVKYMDVFEIDSICYIFMEYCNAGTLDTVIELNKLNSNKLDFKREQTTHY